MVNTYNEKHLLLLVSKGSTVAFHKIFDHYRDKIFSFAMYLTKTDFLAEEITQEVFVRIWDAREKLPEVEIFCAYIRTVARNVAGNHLKRMAIEKIVLKNISEREKNFPTSNEGTETLDSLFRIHQEAIKKLSPKQQKAYTLHHIQGLKNQDIAQIMNISVYTVKEYLKFATKSVRKYVGSKVNLMVLVALNIFFN